MSASDENEKGISELRKRFDMRFSGHEGLRDADDHVSYCVYYSYCVAG